MTSKAPEGSPRSKPGLEQAIREHRRAALVVNTRSRRGRRHYPAVLAGVRAAGFDLLGTFPAARPAAWTPASPRPWT